MITKIETPALLSVFMITFLLLSSSSQAVKLPASGDKQFDEVVFFAFDDHSIPFRSHLRLKLVPCEKRSPVLPLGRPGQPDANMVELYGTVIRIDGQFRMWYMGREFNADKYRYGPFRVCYAVSDDGIKWRKPDLGLVEYNGNKNNNLVGLKGTKEKFEAIETVQVIVLYEPQEHNPKKCYKMFYVMEASTLGVVDEDFIKGFAAYSADGIRWEPSLNNPVMNNRLEPSGLIKFDGLYYINGQTLAQWDTRVLGTYASCDFEQWTKAECTSFRRSYEPTSVYTGNKREQVHMGAALWNRDNVIVGFYGMWHGHKSDDTLLLTMDIGLVVSNDALFYREPVPDFAIIPAKGEPDDAWPALMQAQGFENIGDKTYVWYSAWDEYGWRDKNPKNGGGLVRLAVWERDRLGCLSAKKDDAHFICQPVLFEPDDRIFINAGGLSADGYLTVELLDEKFRPIEGYSGSDSAKLMCSGLRQAVQWKGKKPIKAGNRPIRIRVNYKGDKYQQIRVYAVYFCQK
ncbi:MAG: hypothetical protein JXB29_05250 [Sedimentisphaerales bacterium]|nr:hypothetical protein [Sedimentisphaerales bacterium]